MHQIHVESTYMHIALNYRLCGIKITNLYTLTHNKTCWKYHNRTGQQIYMRLSQLIHVLNWNLFKIQAQINHTNILKHYSLINQEKRYKNKRKDVASQFISYSMHHKTSSKSCVFKFLCFTNKGIHIDVGLTLKFHENITQNITKSWHEVATLHMVENENKRK